MRFHVAREGVVLGEFEEQAFRNKVFAGEITPTDFYWGAGFDDWRPVSEFRVARKTEIIIVDPGAATPPVFPRRQGSFRVIGMVAAIAVLALIVIAALVFGR
jgi:GYF domain 2